MSYGYDMEVQGVERFTGGTVDLVPTGPTRNQLFRYRPAKSGLVSVQLSYVILGAEAGLVGFPTVTGQVSWQVGAGVQVATVDIPNTFTITAAEVVDVRVDLGSTAGASVRVFGAAASCEGPHARRAIRTNQPEAAIAAGANGAMQAVPQFATGLHVYSSDVAMTPSLLLRWSGISDTFNDINKQCFPLGDVVPVPGDARGLRFTNGGGAAIRPTCAWHLSL